MESGRARRSSLKGRERAIVNQTNFSWNCFKDNVGETFERLDGAHNYGLFRAQIHHLERNGSSKANVFSKYVIYAATRENVYLSEYRMLHSCHYIKNKKQKTNNGSANSYINDNINQ